MESQEEVDLVLGPLRTDRAAIAELCRSHGVRRLVVFGSVLTEHFDPADSDVDFLVEFAEDVPSRFDAYFGLKEGLEELLNRPVDLVTTRALENPYFAASVDRGSEEVYAA